MPLRVAPPECPAAPQLAPDAEGREGEVTGDDCWSSAHPCLAQHLSVRLPTTQRILSNELKFQGASLGPRLRKGNRTGADGNRGRGDPGSHSAPGLTILSSPSPPWCAPTHTLPRPVPEAPGTLNDEGALGVMEPQSRLPEILRQGWKPQRLLQCLLLAGILGPAPREALAPSPTGCD